LEIISQYNLNLQQIILLVNKKQPVQMTCFYTGFVQVKLFWTIIPNKLSYKA